MAPSIAPPARFDLAVPLITCDFDPRDADTLVVGGGGEKKAIAVLDVSHRDTIRLVSHLDLAKAEDAPTTIAVGPRTGKAALVFAGINSAKADLEKGKNEHLRVFAVEPAAAAAAAAAPPQPSNNKPRASKAKSQGGTGLAISELVRAALFSSAEKDVFQNLLCLSPQYEAAHRQIGAVATGFGKQSEIVVFDIVPAGPSIVRTRDTLVLPNEAVDMDILPMGDDQWQLAYCHDYDIYLVDITKSKVGAPRCVYSSPDENTSIKPGRPRFRALRYVTSTFVLAALNLPGSSGVLLNGFRLPTSEQEKARLAVSQRLAKTIPRTMGMQVRNLAPPPSPSARQGDTEFVVAVNGVPDSIVLYTLQYQSTAGVDLLVKLHLVTTLKAASGPSPISDFALSHVPPPKTSSSPVRPCASLKLASVTMEPRTVLVHTLPLRKYKDKAARKGRPRRAPRYVLALKSQSPSMRGLVLSAAVVVLALGLVLQGLLEMWDLADPVLGARHVTPSSWHRDRKRPAGHAFLAEHLARLRPGERAVVQVGAPWAGHDHHDGSGVQVVAHDHELHGGAREWDAMPPAERQAWKDKLVEAGHWAETMGEAVFKGMLFGEMAGAVGNMVGG